MKNLSIGVIGVGGRGKLADQAHKPEEGVKIVAGADISDKVLTEFKEKYGPETFVTRDYRQLLAKPEIDAVFVTSPDFMHEEHASAAWRRERRFIWRNRWQLPLRAATVFCKPLSEKRPSSTSATTCAT